MLSHYPFQWDEPPYVHAFPLGYAGLLNHSDKPNCKIESDIEGDVLCIETLRDIKPGEELVWNYGIDPWFKVTKEPLARSLSLPSGRGTGEAGGWGLAACASPRLNPNAQILDVQIVRRPVLAALAAMAGLLHAAERRDLG